MQNPSLELREIIYEITGRCNNHCDYCGSKECWNDTIDLVKIKMIIDRIAEYPPKAIDISGGDPTILPYSIHEYLVKKLKDVGVEVKILFNPKSLQTFKEEKIQILKLYDWIGLSLNTQEEVDLFKEFQYIIPHNKFTVITNFNLKNIFLFNNIKAIVKQFNAVWQVQYTMYTTPQQALAIYQDASACDYLFKQMDNALNEGIKIVPADDMNNGPCGAGSSSIGILSNGSVVPCLSMRSWVENINEIIEGNVLETSLREIWETEFHDYRFKCHKSCKDICNKPYTPKPVYLNEYGINGGSDQLNGVFPLPTPKDEVPSPNITVYAVIKPPSITMYAVTQPPQTIVYAVVPDWTLTDNSSLNVYRYGVFTQTSTNVKPNAPTRYINIEKPVTKYGVVSDNKPKKK